jgi:lipopolysaccharide transport system permease protein
LQKKTDWKWKINAKSRWFEWNLRELLDYRDLIRSFVRRDLLANYHQTVLGPVLDCYAAFADNFDLYNYF